MALEILFKVLVIVSSYILAIGFVFMPALLGFFVSPYFFLAYIISVPVYILLICLCFRGKGF